MKRADRRAAWMACALIQVVPLSAWLATTAKADTITDLYAAKNGPAVCRTLTAFPTFAGIEGIADAIHYNDGFSYSDAGQIEDTSVTLFCPQFAPLLQQFIDTYATPPSVSSADGAIGGPYKT